MNRVKNIFLVEAGSGFTLIELLIVIGIIAILAVVVVVLINPGELLKRSRDASRFSDLSTLNSALGVYSEDTVNALLGSSSVIYLSIPDTLATSTSGDQCQGISLPAAPSGTSYHCSSPSTYKSIDGTGWMPINFSSISSRSPIGSLPADPVNTATTSSNPSYYTYYTDGSHYELTSILESQKYNSLLQSDGGSYDDIYQAGTIFDITPDIRSSGLVAFWTLDDATGSTAADYSGNNNILANVTSGATVWVTGGSCKNNGCLQIPTNHYSGPQIANNSALDSSNVTIMTWLDWTNIASDGWVLGKYPDYDLHITAGGVTQFNINGTICQANTVPSTNVWHLLTASYNGVSANIYFDNSLIKSCANASGISYSGAKFAVGFRSDGTLNGAIGYYDNIRVYNRALTLSEIKAIYTSGY